MNPMNYLAKLTSCFMSYDLYIHVNNNNFNGKIYLFYKIIINEIIKSSMKYSSTLKWILNCLCNIAQLYSPLNKYLITDINSQSYFLFAED